MNFINIAYAMTGLGLVIILAVATGVVLKHMLTPRPRYQPEPVSWHTETKTTSYKVASPFGTQTWTDDNVPDEVADSFEHIGHEMDTIMDASFRAFDIDEAFESLLREEADGGTDPEGPDPTPA